MTGLPESSGENNSLGGLHADSVAALIRLKSPLSTAEILESKRIVDLADLERTRMRSAVDGNADIDLIAFNRLRLLPSSTLERAMRDADAAQSEVLKQWARASHFVSQCVAREAVPTWADLITVQGLIEGRETPALRSRPAQGGNTVYPPPEDLHALRSDFEFCVLDTLMVKDALVEASEIYQWLITLHFFDDGNGRMARLIADWRLALGGWPPLAFPNDASSFVSVLDRESGFSRLTGIFRCYEGVRNSMDALLSVSN